MIPKKMLLAKEQEQPPILSKNPRKEVLAQLVSANGTLLILSFQRSDLSLQVITPKATVHRFAVVRVRVRRRIVSTLDLIIRRGAYPFPESKPGQTNKIGIPKFEDRKPGPEGSRTLLRDSTLVDPQAWILSSMRS